jgi:peptide/nickel transport system ATP-binding protein
MTDSLLSVRGLRTHLGDYRDPVRAVDGVSFDIQAGEIFALLGESGCGKSMTALSLLRLLPASGRIVAGEIVFQGRDLLRLPEASMREVRGAGIAMVFQEPMTSLNPVMTVGDQVGEALDRHNRTSAADRRRRVRELLEAVRIPDADRRIEDYPHQLSGGMKQRVVIAIALAGDPALLVADEPTTALDVTIQAQVLDLLRTLQHERRMSILLITHDLGVVAETADRVGVMYAGQIVELATREAFFAAPRHPYSRKLFDSLPGMDKRRGELQVIPGFVPSLSAEFEGCRFAPRCDAVMDVCRTTLPAWHESDGHGALCHLFADAAKPVQAPAASVKRATGEALRAPRDAPAEPLLDTRELAIHFPIHKGLFKRTVGYVRAVDGVELSIPRGRTLALVGESGCGKTTVGKGILQLLHVTGGQVRFEGEELTTLDRAQLRRRRSEMQIIFQDPVSSMNPRMLVGDIIAEGLVVQGIGAGRADHASRIATLLEQVGMPADSAGRYPHEFSGGQRQRICIARALAVEPKLIICDEPTSALDVSVQAQILNLLKRLQSELGLSYLFITHDVSVVSYIADEVAVMYLGRIVEHGDVETILNSPSHPYTDALMAAVPRIENGDGNGNGEGRKVLRVEGDLPSPVDPPTGCHFHPRCSKVMPVCVERYPARKALDKGHSTRCHLYDD